MLTEARLSFFLYCGVLLPHATPIVRYGQFSVDVYITFSVAESKAYIMSVQEGSHMCH